jgi:hypothetical protein
VRHPLALSSAALGVIQVKILKESAAQSKTEPSDAVAIVSYDEKPGIALAASSNLNAVQELAAPLRAQADHDDHRHRDHAADQRQRVGIVAAVRLGDLRLERTVVGMLRHFSDPQLPTRNSRGREDAGPCPGIIGEMAFDFPFVVRSEDQKHVFAFLQRASEAHEPLGLQRIHERPVSLPVLLLFERPPRRIGRAVTTHDHKQILHAVPP